MDINISSTNFVIYRSWQDTSDTSDSRIYRTGVPPNQSDIQRDYCNKNSNSENQELDNSDADNPNIKHLQIITKNTL